MTSRSESTAPAKKNNAPRRKSLRLDAHDRQLLVNLYIKWRISVDQFEGLPDDQKAFCQEWRTLSGRNDVDEDVIHYMRTQRKRGLWVRLEGERKASPPAAKLTAEETEVLILIYKEYVTVQEMGSDVLGYDPELSELIAKEFATTTGRTVPAHQLKVKLTALRKRGLLPKVSERISAQPTDQTDQATAAESVPGAPTVLRRIHREDIGFGDIDLAAV